MVAVNTTTSGAGMLASHSSKAWRLLATCAFLCSGQLRAEGIGWYTQSTQKCEFRSPLAAALPGSSLPMAIVGSQAGGEYFRVSKGIVNAAMASATVKADVQDLSDSSLGLLRSAIGNLENGGIVADAALSLSALVPIDGLLQVGTGQLISWLSGKAEAAKQRLDQLSNLVTSGGKSFTLVAFRVPSAPFKPYLFMARGYQIQVGLEARPRRFAFEVCLLPIQLEISKFETHDPGPYANNKIISKQADGTWKTWDIQDAKYDNKILLLTGQDELYSYFNELGWTDIYRIHSYGGSLQKTSDNVTWSTLYKAVESE